jgi:DNA-binding MarR family transcriptional regulator
MPEVASVTEEILISLRRVIRAIDQHSRHLATTYGLTGPQAVILSELVREGELTGSQLANRVSLSQATITDILKRLESRDLITRKQDDADKRRQLIKATPDAEVLVRQSLPLLQERFEKRLSDLKDWEKMQLLSSLQRIAEMMNAEDIDASPVLASGSITASIETIEKPIDEKGKP